MSLEIIYSLSLWIFPILWIVLCLIVPTKLGPRAQHTIWVIYKPNGPINLDGSTTEFAHVQEKGEYRLGKIVGNLAGLPFTLIDVDLNLTIIVLIAQAATIIVANDRFNRLNFVDYAGHGAEIMAAQKAGVLDYREAEIERMSDDLDKQGQDINEGLDRSRWLAGIIYLLGRN